MTRIRLPGTIWQTQKLRSMRYVQQEDLEQTYRWIDESERLAKKDKRYRDKEEKKSQ